MTEVLRCSNIFVNITPVIEKKKELCFCHQHHLYDPSYWDDVILDEDRTAGKIAGCELAEAFWTEFPIMDTKWGRKAGSILLDL